METRFLNDSRLIQATSATLNLAPFGFENAGKTEKWRMDSLIHARKLQE